MEQTNSCRRGGGRGGLVERRGRDESKNMCERLRDMDIRERIDCGREGRAGWRGAKGKKGIGTTVIK